MKKFLALMLVLILALPLAATAFAESGQVVQSVGTAFTTFFNPYFQGTMIGYAFPLLRTAGLAAQPEPRIRACPGGKLGSQ